MKKGFTLIEVIVAVAMLGILALAFLSAISNNYSMLTGGKEKTQNLFLAQESLEQKIDEVKAELASPSPSVSPAAIKFDVFEGTAYHREVDGYQRSGSMSDISLTTVVAKVRTPEFPVPVASNSEIYLRRADGNIIPDSNNQNKYRSGLSVRAVSSVTEPTPNIFLVNKHEWYVSRLGFNIPMVDEAYIDRDNDRGRLYPLFPNDYIQIPISSYTDQLNTSDINNTDLLSKLSGYEGRHLIYTITPYARTGKKGETVFSDPVFLTGPSVVNNLALHLDASLISKDDSNSLHEATPTTTPLYVKQWNNTSPTGSAPAAVQNSLSQMPVLHEVQYQEDAFVWGKSLSVNGTDTNLEISSFNPSSMSSFSVFLVAKINSVETGDTFISGGTNAWRLGIGTVDDSNNIVFEAGGTAAAKLGDGRGLPVSVDAGWHIYHCKADMASGTGELSIRLDGTTDALDIMGDYSGNVDFDNFRINLKNMDVAEILVYDGALDVSDQTSVEDYLVAKYDPDPATISVGISSLKPMSPVTVVRGTGYVPPATVPAWMTNGLSQNVGVVWSGLNDWSIEGAYTITGTALLDSSKTVTQIVNVVGVGSINPLADMTIDYGVPNPLPSFLPGLLKNGDAYSVAVSWSITELHEWTGLLETVPLGDDYELVATSLLEPTVKASRALHVVPKMVTGVTVTPELALLPVGNTLQLVAEVQPSDATNKTLVWSSTDPSIVSVDNTGLVNAHVDGGGASVTITAVTEDGGYVDSCDVYSIIPVTHVTLNKASTTVAVGSSETLVATVHPANATIKGVTWSSSNEARAMVASNGQVTGVAAGTATITVTTDNGSKSASCTVTVVVPVASISFSPSSVNINRRNNSNYNAAGYVVFNPPNATDKGLVEWTSSNTAVATVNSSGVVTLRGDGFTNISVKSRDGLHQAILPVTVYYDNCP